MLSKKNACPWLWISVLVIILDQLSKWWVVQHVMRWQSIKLLPFLNIILNYNRGAAFSLFDTASGWQVYFFSAMGILLSVFCLIWLIRTVYTDRLLSVGICLIMGGGVGNVIDRLRLGHVIDFIDFHVGAWHYPTFNVADSAISIGVVLLLLRMFFFRKQCST